MEWLSQMVESTTWRQTIYDLAQHPQNEDCPFLSLSMPCIGVKESLIGELISVPMAWNTLEIFLKCVIYVLQPLLISGKTIKDQTFASSISFLQPKRSKHTSNSEMTHLDQAYSNSEMLPSIDEVKTFIFNQSDNLEANDCGTIEVQNSRDVALDRLPHFLVCYLLKLIVFIGTTIKLYIIMQFI